MIDYDQKLIMEVQAYFSERYGRNLTADEAESFLKSLVNLYDSFSIN